MFPTILYTLESCLEPRLHRPRQSVYCGARDSVTRRYPRLEVVRDSRKVKFTEFRETGVPRSPKPAQFVYLTRFMSIRGPPGPVMLSPRGVHYSAIGHQACGDTFHVPSAQCMTRVPLNCHKERDMLTFDMAGVLRKVKQVVSAVF